MNRIMSVFLVFVLVLGCFAGLCFTKAEVKNSVWNGGYDSDLQIDSSGNYLISSAEELAYAVSTFGLDENGNKLKFKLTSDIYLNDITAIDWTNGTVREGYNITPNSWFAGTTAAASTYLADGKSGIFKGSLDGNGYTVFGLWYSPDMTDTASGLIPSVDGTVKNLTLSHSYVVGGVYAGALSSYFKGELSGSNVDETVTVVVKNNIESPSYAVGGLVGWSNGITITECGFSGKLIDICQKAHEYGFVGTFWNTKITAVGGFSIGNQPFTASSAVLSATSAEEAEATFKNRYVVSDVYTNTHSVNNNVKYKIGDTTTTITNIFTFCELETEKMLGVDALNNMSEISSEIWYSTEKTPVLRSWGTAHGDADEDGVAPTYKDLAALRENLIGSETRINVDFNRNGVSNICDLVALNNYRENIDSKKCQHAYETQVISPSTATEEGTAKYICQICGDYYEGSLPTQMKILSIGGNYSSDSTKYLYQMLSDAGTENVTIANLVLDGGLDDVLEDDSGAYLKNADGKWRESDTSVLEALADEEWDVITLQQSGKTESYKNLQNVLEFINKNSEKSEIFWNMNWTSSKQTYSEIVNVVKTEVASKEPIGGIIPTGTAVENLKTSHLGDALTREGEGLSYDYGCYTAGLTMLYKLTCISPDKVNFIPDEYGFMANNKSAIDEAVVNALNKPYEITESTYKTSSVPEELKILAIGNSFSIDGMEYLWNILRDVGVKNVTLGNLYIAGCTIDMHWKNITEDSDAYKYYKNTSGQWNSRTASLKTALLEEDWDIITVQQGSPTSGVPSSFKNLDNLLDYVNSNKTNKDAKIFWHMTWAYQQDHVEQYFENYNCDQMTMYNAIVNTAQSEVITKELIDGLIPSGTAIQNLRTSYLGDTLTRDTTHLSKDFGCYAAGLTWMTAITGISADKVTWVPSSYPILSKNKDMINEAVKNSIKSPFSVTDSTYTESPETPELTGDAAILWEKGFDMNQYEPLDWEPTVNAFYSSTGSTPPHLVYNSLSPNFIGSKLLTKQDLPVGSIILLDSGYAYRPEGWIDANTSNTSATRPNSVTAAFTVVDEAWWGNFTIRGFNLCAQGASTVMTEADTCALRIYVPKALSEDEKLMQASGLNHLNYKAVDMELVVGAFYDSHYLPKLGSESIYSPYFIGSKLFTKQELPVGSVIIVDSGYQYRPERWIDANTVNETRPNTVKINIVVVDEAWWSNFTICGFNLSYIGSSKVMAESDMQAIRIYVPK